MILKDDDAPELIYVNVDDDEEEEERRPLRRSRRRRVFRFPMQP